MFYHCTYLTPHHAFFTHRSSRRRRYSSSEDDDDSFGSHRMQQRPPRCSVTSIISLKECYAHVSEWWSQEYKRVTSLTFPYRPLFEVLYLWLSNAMVVEEHCMAHALIITIVAYLLVLAIRLLIRTVIVNAWVQQFYPATLAFGSHGQRSFKHSSYVRERKVCCTSVFVTFMLEHVRWPFEKKLIALRYHVQTSPTSCLHISSFFHTDIHH